MTRRALSVVPELSLTVSIGLCAIGPPSRPSAQAGLRFPPVAGHPPGVPAVEIRGVSAGYAGRDALADVSLSVEKGELCAVLGPNGAGKSTLVKLLSGALRPRHGTVTVLGQDLGALDR